MGHTPQGIRPLPIVETTVMWIKGMWCWGRGVGVVAFVGLAMMAGATRAGQDENKTAPQPCAVTLYFENDGTFVKRNKPHDRHYSNGLKITFAHHPVWAAQLAARLPWNPAQEGQPLRTAAGYAIGQNIYTPDHIEISTLIADDRPYAGWLYGGVYLQRATDRVFDHVELDVGVIGQASLAEYVQTRVHDIFSAVDPHGWDHQLRDEFAFDITFQRAWKIPLLTVDGANAVELIPQAGITLGTIHRHVSIGALARVGVNLPQDFGPGRIAQPAAATAPRPRGPGAYGFVRVGGQLVEHNTFLEGNNYRSSHGVDPETSFGQVQVGLVIRWEGFELGYSQTYYSRQFKGQRGRDSLGGLTLTWTGVF